MPALELDAIETRILGVLIEKETTTPDQYPLSLNALSSGCNQKSNRHPVLELSDSEVSAGVERLRRKSLVGASHSAGSRVERYKHAAGVVWQLTPTELAVLGELMLRGAQMPGELRSRADRMSRIETLEVLGTTLEGLRQKGFVQRLEPLPGTRAPQWDQIVGQPGGPTPPPRRTPLADGAMPIPRASEATARRESVAPDVVARHDSVAPDVVARRDGVAPDVVARREPPTSAPTPALEGRLGALEAEVARLRALVESLVAARPTS